MKHVHHDLLVALAEVVDRKIEHYNVVTFEYELLTRKETKR